MTTATYQGRDDLRILGQGDLAKSGVEIEGELAFPIGVAVEVPADVAKALTENEHLYGLFEISADEAPVEEVKADENKTDDAPTRKAKSS